jgi:hypothetical protein
LFYLFLSIGVNHRYYARGFVFSTREEISF